MLDEESGVGYMVASRDMSIGDMVSNSIRFHLTNTVDYFHLFQSFLWI